MSTNTKAISDEIRQAAYDCARRIYLNVDDGGTPYMTDDDILEVAKAIHDAVMAEREWYPIETAPKDGTRFLAAVPDGEGWVVGVALWCKTPHVPLYGFHFTEGDPEDWDICRPALWKPLPAAPKAGPET